ncbi:diguanylate cyclase [Teredinibacter turnerae]|uniref:sensor domain-containing diguanylate cyclase n=1 Tax=Teredinibacter turnerae TaxID=2426 RepID=UPI00037325FF|nr:sensor domain-containing diguanylate cyclase [Teredinibacter turnerae]
MRVERLDRKEKPTHYLARELAEIIRVDPELFDFIDRYVFDGLWYWNLEKPEDEWMSPQFWLTLGYAPEEKKHLAAEWQDIIDPDDLLVAQQNFKQHCDDPGYPYDQIVRYTHQSGETVWLRCRGFAIRDEKGVPTRMLGIHTNVSRLKHIEERYKKIIATMDRVYADLRVALDESEQLFETIPDAILQVDQDGRIVKSNSRATEMFGYSASHLQELTVEDLVPDAIRIKHSKLRHRFQDAPEVREMGNDAMNLSAVTKSGKEIFVDIRLSPYNTKYGLHTIAVVRDITERRKMVSRLKAQEEEEQKLFKLSSTDSMTGVFNRGYFLELANRAHRQGERYDHNFCVMMLDVDNFKSINDRFGHAEGDRALTQIGNILKNSVRKTDIIGRVGGEEFAIVLPESSIDQGVVLADKILYNIEDARTHSDDPDGLGGCPTLSIGLVAKGDENETFNELLYRADQLLYKAKHTGKAKVVY